jgi:hypothetical protein
MTKWPKGGTNISVLIQFRMTVIALDLALVAYIGSHRSRFDHYINTELKYIDLRDNKEYHCGFKCSPRRLACPDEFLESNKIWVFKFWNAETDHGGLPKPQMKELFILTDILLTFGVQSGRFPLDIMAFGTAMSRKGHIARVEDPENGRSDNVVNSHWYS